MLSRREAHSEHSFSQMAASLSKTLKLHRAYLSLPKNPTPTSSISAFSTYEAPLPPPAAAATATASQAQEDEGGRWRKLLLFIPGAITFGLGTWQIFRRQEKVEMLDYRRKRLEMEPIAWNRVDSPDQDLDSLEFRKVVCEGLFYEGKSIYLGPRSRSISGVTENGYYLITPLIPLTSSESGSLQLPVLVNRGWVPRDWRKRPVEDSQDVDRSSISRAADAQQDEKSIWWKFWSQNPTVSQVKEPVITPIRVTGVIRGSEKPSIFVPANDPNSGQWFYVDVPMIARACGLPENTIYLEDIDEDVGATNPYPVPKDVNTLIHYSVMPQDHLNYTITWYSLSVAVTFMAFRRIRPKRTRR